MAIDGESGAASGRRGVGNAYLPNTRAAGMVFGASNDASSGGPVFRSQNPRSSPVTSVQSAAHPNVYPRELQNLIGEGEESARDVAWDEFLAKHSRLLLHVARKVMPTGEGAMDAYANVLERLRRNGCKALLAYTPDGRSRFTTWLVVVTRRMCVDFYRQQYGRPRAEEPTAATVIEREARRRLVTFAGLGEAHEQIPDLRDSGPDGALRHQQLLRALDRSVSALSPEDQLLLKLRFHDELAASKIAAVLAFPSPFHVYRRLKAVCAELRRALMLAGVEDAAP